MKSREVQPGQLVETSPEVGVARGRVLERAVVDVNGRETWRWKVRLELPGGPETVYLRSQDFELLEAGPAPDAEDLAATRRRKRRGGAA